jgi:hypothetical protein
MAATKYLARDLTCEIENPDVPTTFIHIGGLNTLTHSPSTSRADTTDFDSNGHDEHLVASRGETWTLAGFSIEDVVTGDRDAGQEAVEAIGKLIGLGGFGNFNTSPCNTIAFEASAEVTLAGGGHNDAAQWQAVLTINGAPEFTPAAPSS